jgi:hypothetical protein
MRLSGSAPDAGPPADGRKLPRINASSQRNAA